MCEIGCDGKVQRSATQYTNTHTLIHAPRTVKNANFTAPGFLAWKAGQINFKNLLHHPPARESKKDGRILWSQPTILRNRIISGLIDTQSNTPSQRGVISGAKTFTTGVTQCCGLCRTHIAAQPPSPQHHRDSCVEPQNTRTSAARSPEPPNIGLSDTEPNPPHTYAMDSRWNRDPRADAASQVAYNAIRAAYRNSQLSSSESESTQETQEVQSVLLRRKSDFVMKADDTCIV
ncbi:hypothetical protein EDC01DRAFT_636269 [Geopyxis carbonaria]|nr:hypothetical protein EDC01DRAFT_636269 [Geopyxis carbonaria]